jgi:hypothetical protein
MTLVPHADITLKTLIASDCLKGTLTASITTVSDYYDGKWTQVAVVKDTPVAFNFDTSDKPRRMEATASETREVPPSRANATRATGRNGSRKARDRRGPEMGTGGARFT